MHIKKKKLNKLQLLILTTKRHLLFHFKNNVHRAFIGSTFDLRSRASMQTVVYQHCF